MKKVITLSVLLVVIGISLSTLFFYLHQKRNSSLPIAAHTNVWSTDLKEAVNQGLKEKKTVALIFEGSDWCPACMNLENTILSKEEFSKSVQPYFILYRVDFPSHKVVSEEIQKLHQRLKIIYSIHAFPTIVLLDTNQREIAKLEGTPDSSSDLIQWMVGKIQKKSLDTLSVSEMKSLLNNIDIEKQSCCEEISSFCRGDEQLEKYHLVMHKEDKTLIDQVKFEIKQQDIHNIHKWNLHLALIDFVHLVKKGINPEEAINPLIQYVEEYGKNDLRHHWRIEIIMAFFLSHHQKHKLALHHARKAFNVAPHAMKKEITQEIMLIKKEMQKN
jgi:protein disulfide-isomerase